ncbi:MAG: radical SAM protein [Granulosicoccus sp.]
MDTVYIERAVRDHPRTDAITKRYPRARIVPIERYGDVFNAAAQNFRHQKSNPALILARKPGRRILPTPPGYHIGGKHNYYFSHMLNCIYDCRYCFLQGMYQSANYIVFVNEEDFFADIDNMTKQHEGDVWFFSGYDCDSLALDPITGFVNACLSHLETNKRAHLELRTKSTQIRPLLKHSALPNVVVAYSLSPEPIVRAEEHGTPSLAKRLDALKQLQDNGWNIGLRFDPLLYADNFETLYGDMFKQVFDALDMEKVHSVSLGVFRLPKGFYKKLVRLYPDAKLLAAPISARGGMMSYPEETESIMRSFCEQTLETAIRPDQFFPCS